MLVCLEIESLKLCGNIVKKISVFQISGRNSISSSFNILPLGIALKLMYIQNLRGINKLNGFKLSVNVVLMSFNQKQTLDFNHAGFI